MAENRIDIEGGYAFAPSPRARQFYETTVLVRVSGRTMPVTFGVVPARSIDAEQRSQAGQVRGLVEIVHGKRSETIPLAQLGVMTTAVALMLDPEFNDAHGPVRHHPVWSEFRHEAESFPQQTGFMVPPWWRHPRDGSDTPLAVAETLVFRTPIPFESSPLSGQSLASIVTGSGGGALVVAVVSGAAAPWLLAAVPAGVILMKVANGAGDALHDVVKHKLLRWLDPELLEKD